jgi:thiol-disulfide isomerase/thioredoxin
MKKKITGIIAGIIILASSIVCAQVKNAELKVGDFISTKENLGEITSFRSKTIALSDLKTKLIILDFWATWCSPCIGMFEKLETLQKKYNGQLTVIPVTQEKEEKARTLLKEKSVSLPSIINDKKLSELFPHTLLPHEIWISPNGKVLAITSHEEVTEENINRFLKTGTLETETKIDLKNFSMKTPLFLDNKDVSFYRYRSILGKHIKGAPSYIYPYRDSLNKMNGISLVNFNPISLIYAAFCMQGYSLPNFKRILLEGKYGKKQLDSNFFYVKNDTLLNQLVHNFDYSYCLQLDKGIDDSIFYRNFMLPELIKLLPFKIAIEKIKTNVLVVKRNEGLGTQNPIAIGGKMKMNYIDTLNKASAILKSVENMPFKYFFDNVLLFYQNSDPIINESGYTDEKVTMELELNWKLNDSYKKSIDEKQLKKALNNYGLDLIHAEREIDMLVIGPKENNNTNQ